MRPVVLSEEQVAVLLRDYPAGIRRKRILETINAMGPQQFSSVAALESCVQFKRLKIARDRYRPTEEPSTERVSLGELYRIAGELGVKGDARFDLEAVNKAALSVAKRDGSRRRQFMLWRPKMRVSA